MNKFTAVEITAINTAISKGTYKAFAGLAFVTDSDRADLAQNVWVKICESADATKGDLAGFAYRCTVHAGVDFLRGHKGARLDSNHVSTDDTMGDDDSSTLLDAMPSPVPNPLQALIAKRREVAVNVALGTLTSDQLASFKESDAPATGAARVRKIRAIADVQESILLRA